MVVIVLSAAPAGLRGALTRWMLEVSAGVYVGHLSTRVREQVWELIQANIGQGRALLVYPVKSEQRFAILSLGHERVPVDVEGLLVMQAPSVPSAGVERFPRAIPVPTRLGTLYTIIGNVVASAIVLKCKY